MGLQKTTININGENKTLIVINHNKENTAVQAKTVDQIHHIHILDRSGSMGYYINELINNVQETIKAINDDDLISIVWFSSPGQYRTLVKGARKTDNLNKLLDTIRSTLYTTCFSEPLREVNTIIDELYALCPTISITLFTDGNPVVPWSIEEEHKRVFAEVDKMQDKVISFNTVGYGNWYDRDMLVKISSMSEYGTFLHSSKINEYLDIFNRNFEKISDVVVDNVTVRTDPFSPCPIIYLNRKFTKMENGELKITKIDKEKNQFFVLLNSEEDLGFEYNGTRYYAKDITQKPTEATITNFLYAYAYNQYYVGNTQISLDILAKALHDKSFADELLSAFTYDERSRFTDRLYRAVFKPNTRYLEGKCTDEYIPNKDAFCVMDLLYLLQEKNAIYIPFSNNVEKYSRIGRKSEDTFNLFERTKEEIRVPFSNFVWNKKHMNLSILFYIKGTVKINPAVAKRVHLDPVFNTGMFRNRTIIKDGTLNIKKIEVLISDVLMEEINVCNPNIISEIIDATNDEFRVILDLEALPIINRTYIDMSTKVDNIFDVTLAISKLEARDKLIGYYLTKAGDVADKPINVYSPDQIQVLKEHGIDTSLNYKGVEVIKPKVEDSDSYETRTLEFYLSGCSSWPKVDELLDRLATGKKLTTALDIMKTENEFINNVATMNGFKLDTINMNGKNILSLLKEDTKKELTKVRALINALKMAKILTGDFFTDLKVNDKGEYQYAKEGLTMIAKVARTREYF